MGDNPSDRSVRRDKVCNQIDVSKLFVDGKMLSVVQAQNLNALLVNPALTTDFHNVFSTIQSAINHTQVLGTTKLILVAPGTYVEDVTVTAPSSFTLQGLVNSSHGNGTQTAIDGTFTIPHNGTYRFNNIILGSSTSTTATYSLVVTSDAVDSTSVFMTNVLVNTPTGGAGVGGALFDNTGAVSSLITFIDDSNIDDSMWTGSGTGRMVIATSNSRFNGVTTWGVTAPSASTAHLFEFTQGTRVNGSLVVTAASFGEVRLADALFVGNSKVVFDGSAAAKLEMHACSFQLNSSSTSPVISVEGSTVANFAMTYSTISSPNLIDWISGLSGGLFVTVHEVTARVNDNSAALTNGVAGGFAVTLTNSVGVNNPA